MDELLASALRLATPLLLAALAGVLSERSGVIDLGLEGKMLATAFAAAAVASASGSLPLALAAALATGLALSALHGWACVRHGGDQVVTGMAITMCAAGLTVVLGTAWFHQGGHTPPLPDALRLAPLGLGLRDALQAAPAPLPALARALLGHHVLVYGALALVPALWWALYRTGAGLRLRACGENPAMVDAAGGSVAALRHTALAGNGVLCALAGCTLVLAQNPQFVPGMTAGRGYMALAAMIFGRWHPLGALAACLLFGTLDAAAIRLQGAPLPALLGGGTVPVQAIQALPYVLTIVLLGGLFSRRRSAMPAALGVPYVKDGR